MSDRLPARDPDYDYRTPKELAGEVDKLEGCLLGVAKLARLGEW